jgi:hypothetical protein
VSLDVYLTGEKVTVECECAQCGNRHSRETNDTLYDRNITHNLAQMAGQAGIYEALWRPEEIGITKARDLIGPLQTGLDLLKSDPARFKAFNPANGWGDYDGLVDFVSSYLRACRGYPDANVSASR